MSRKYLLSVNTKKISSETSDAMICARIYMYFLHRTSLDSIKNKRYAT